MSKSQVRMSQFEALVSKDLKLVKMLEALKSAAYKARHEIGRKLLSNAKRTQGEAEKNYRDLFTRFKAECDSKRIRFVFELKDINAFCPPPGSL